MALRSGVTVVIPVHPPRIKNGMLDKAVRSVTNQERKFSDCVVVVDINKEGAGPTRTKGMRSVTTEWTAFLDSDDELYPNHLEVLIHAAIDNGADLVYPWFDVKGGGDPFPMHEGKVFDPEAPNMFPITVLAKTELLQATDGFVRKPSPTHPHILEGEDWCMWLQIIALGGKIVHVPVRTWRWNHGQHNTSGLPDRW